ncbi:MAG: shikimate dehydrogenase [Lysobacterales bacterium]|jgi:shikimate dehydrogenase
MPGLIRLGLFGQPVAASPSPSVHRSFARQFGLEVDYRLIETAAGGLQRALLDFRRQGGEGCNITVPLKGEAWRIAEAASEAAERAQAANTLVRRRGGGWEAHNTDGVGLVADLRNGYGVNLSGQRVLVLGAGGAAAGILGNLLRGGAAGVTLVNRNLGRARDLAARFAANGTVRVSAWKDLPAQGGFDLVINATSLGHAGKAPALGAASFAPESLCYDLNYLHAAEPLRQLCERFGQAYADGIGMLVEQAAESFYLWTGKRPDTGPVIPAIRGMLRERE